jgi:ABC-type bacteriocin/lantibiotic exporter with double-glycine peptidase domain
VFFSELFAGLFVLLFSLDISVEDSSGSKTCGIDCCYSAAVLLDGDFTVSRSEFLEENRSYIGPIGSSLGDLESVLREQGLNSVAMKSAELEDVDKWIESGLIGIAHLSTNHYVVVNDVQGKFVRGLDPPQTMRMPVADFKKLFTGNILLVSKDEIHLGTSNRWQIALAIGIAVSLISVGYFAASKVRWGKRS